MAERNKFTTETAKKAAEARRGKKKRITLAVQQVFSEVFTDLQKDEKKPWALKKWAQENPTEFYKLATKLIPVQLTGEDGEAIKVNITGMKIT